MEIFSAFFPIGSEPNLNWAVDQLEQLSQTCLWIIHFSLVLAVRRTNPRSKRFFCKFFQKLH